MPKIYAGIIDLAGFNFACWVIDGEARVSAHDVRMALGLPGPVSDGSKNHTLEPGD